MDSSYANFVHHLAMIETARYYSILYEAACIYMQAFGALSGEVARPIHLSSTPTLERIHFG